MAHSPQDRDASPSAARREKLNAIASVFGPAVAERLARAGERPAAAGADAHPDPDRQAWQRNRLIQHLRNRVAEPPAPTDRQAAPPHAPATPNRTGEDRVAPGMAATNVSTSLLRLPSLSLDDDLSAEHPAVIAHLLRAAPRDRRVSVLRALPGRTARSVMQRLRAP